MDSLGGFKSCWSIIKGDVLMALDAIQQGHVFKFRLLNTAYITLLPKKVDEIEVKDFRPISLIHSFAKLVTKLLANQLAPLLPSLVPGFFSRVVVFVGWFLCLVFLLRVLV